MLHGSLFSGIGGFDLAAEWMRWENVFHCETSPFCQQVLNYYWPQAASYEDITETDFSAWRGKIDVLTGGFPCQPYSIAGLRKGKNDERHLWPEMLRAIREIQPRYIVGENVPGLLNWNGGMVFDEVLANLEAEGYATIPFILPAAAVNAPQRRERVWIISSRESTQAYLEGKGKETQRLQFFGEVSKSLHHRKGLIADANSHRRKKRITATIGNEKNSSSRFHPEHWSDWPIESPVCAGAYGLSARLDGITFPKWQSETVKGAGNAIVPQVAYRIFKAIDNYETFRLSTGNLGGTINEFII